MYLKTKGLLRLGYNVNIYRPASFNEKILFKKLVKKDQLESLAVYADKYKVREIITGLGYSKYLNALYYVWYSPNEFDFDKLPDSFVMKANHGSGMNLIVHNKYQIPSKTFVSLAKKWLTIDYNATVGGTDFQYDLIKPAIIIEKLLIPAGDDSLNDYKFFCFHGKVEFVNLFRNNNEIPISFVYDRNWKQLNFSLYNKFKIGNFKKPEKFEEMIHLAEILSKPFDFVRIDLYHVNGEIFFGEYTFTPGGGFTRFFPKKYDYVYGGKFNHE